MTLCRCISIQHLELVAAKMRDLGRLRYFVGIFILLGLVCDWNEFRQKSSCKNEFAGVWTLLGLAKLGTCFRHSSSQKEAGWRRLDNNLFAISYSSHFGLFYLNSSIFSLVCFDCIISLSKI